MSDHFATAARLMGGAPINPIGECFDSAAICFLALDTPERARLVHGIGVANMPGQEGTLIGHAWIELDGTAYDTTWGVQVDAGCYRAELQLQHAVEYTRAEAIALWLATNYPGPWDARIKAVTDGP